jgi:hypothetical protein
MPIRLPDAPPNALDVIRRDVPRFLGVAPPNSDMRAMSGGAAMINIAAPHPVYVATIEDVLARRVLANARETTWRYFLVRGNDDAFAAAELTGGEVAHVNEGPFVEGTSRAMIFAEDLDRVREADYEMRLLRIPALYVVAVWLRSSNDDILVPSAPAPAPLQANAPYDEGRFTDALTPLAQQRGAIDDERA